MEEIKVLLREKKKTELSSEDKEKIDIIETLMTNEAMFFQLDMQTAYGILKFLGIKEEDLGEYYTKLISIDNYNNLSSVYRLDEELLNPEKGK